jgi:hypothetical protein
MGSWINAGLKFFCGGKTVFLGVLFLRIRMGFFKGGGMDPKQGLFLLKDIKDPR